MGCIFLFALTFHTIAPIFSLVFWPTISTAQEGYMVQAKFSIEEAHIHFLNKYKAYGFKDKSSMIRAAINSLKNEYERNLLKKSADLYSEIYTDDKELQDMTDSAIIVN